jgi:predicted DNA-binding transcriptional regulator YafY
MSKTARLFQLMQCLRSAAPPVTAEVLAQELDVSPRTVHRDIDALRGLGAVIDGAAGFGFTLIEDATLPPLGFRDDELEALVLGLREVEQIGDPDLAKAAGAALRKLQGRLPPSQSHRLKHAVLMAKRFNRPTAPVVSVARLRKATWDELAVDIAYADVNGRETQRRVDPLTISYMDKSTVLIARCHLRQGFRAFRLDRMREMTVTEQSFRPRRIPLLRQALAEIRAESEKLAEHRDSKD